MDHCKIPRWQILKSTLNNLSYENFLDQLKKDTKGVCLDVRTAEEYASWKIDGAINFDYLSQHLADDLEALDNTMNYYVYCRTSRRSLRVGVLLQNMGIKHVYHLKDGIMDVVDRE